MGVFEAVVVLRAWLSGRDEWCDAGLVPYRSDHDGSLLEMSDTECRGTGHVCSACYPFDRTFARGGAHVIRLPKPMVIHGGHDET